MITGLLEKCRIHNPVNPIIQQIQIQTKSKIYSTFWFKFSLRRECPSTDGRGMLYLLVIRMQHLPKNSGINVVQTNTEISELGFSELRDYWKKTEYIIPLIQ